MTERVRLRDERTLAEGRYALKEISFDYRRKDGQWQSQKHWVFDRGDGAVVLPYDPARQTVLLTRQFRLPAYLVGYREPLIEACAGMLDEAEAETRIRAEAEEELGVRLGPVQRVLRAFTSPGAVTERLTFFVAPYSVTDRIGAGGGVAAEGEDVEVLELPVTRALAMVGRGEIVDAKTILLLLYLAQNVFASPPKNTGSGR
jgi:nudix-type nucleoside diphosphatase (YffH/AdpP family)